MAARASHIEAKSISNRWMNGPFELIHELRSASRTYRSSLPERSGIATGIFSFISFLSLAREPNRPVGDAQLLVEPLPILRRHVVPRAGAHRADLIGRDGGPGDVVRLERA